MHTLSLSLSTFDLFDPPSTFVQSCRSIGNKSVLSIHASFVSKLAISSSPNQSNQKGVGNHPNLYNLGFSMLPPKKKQRNDSPNEKSQIGRLANHHRQRRHVKFYAQGLNLSLRRAKFHGFGWRDFRQKGGFLPKKMTETKRRCHSLLMINGSIGSMLVVP